MVETKLRRCCLSLLETDLVSCRMESFNSELRHRKGKGFAFHWSWQDTTMFPLLKPGHFVSVGFPEHLVVRGRDECEHTRFSRYHTVLISTDYWSD